MINDFTSNIELNFLFKNSQQIRSNAATEDIVHTELANQRRDLEIEYQRRTAALRNEMENEMRSQLRRQAAAHSDHISDVLEVQQKELGRMNARVLDEAVTSEKSAHKQVRPYLKPNNRSYLAVRVIAL